MMTRTTLKALWFGGGGILATYLAVSPAPPTTQANPPSTAPSSAVVAESMADGLNAQADRLRERAATASVRTSTRNPFRFNTTRPLARREMRREQDSELMATPPVPSAPPPAVSLVGVAHTSGTRTAILTLNGHLYLVREGDPVGNGYTVAKIDPDTVLLRDSDGTDQRILLR